MKCSKKVRYKGITFDSPDEYRYYLKLEQEIINGTVLSVELQPKMALISNFMYQGERRQGITYTPDFLVLYADGNKVYIDVKGMETQQGNLRRKLFEYYYPDKVLLWVSESKKYGVDGWIDTDKLKKIRQKNKRDKLIERNILNE